MKNYNKKIYTLFLFLLFSVCVAAQENGLVGIWQIQNAEGIAGPFVKVFLPDGRLYGFSYEGNDETMKTWLMGRYHVTSTSTYSEDIEYHTDPFYMGHLDMHYSIGNGGNMLTTDYTIYGFDGKRSPAVVEKWSKQAIGNDIIKKLSDNWDKLLQQARQTSLYSAPNDSERDKLAEYILNNYNEIKEEGPKKAYMLMCRAELDTTNWLWQADVVRYMNKINMAPSIGEKYARRIISLSEAKATTPSDTLVVTAYGMYGLFISHQEGRTAEAEKIIRQAIRLDEKSGRPDNMTRGLLYMYLGFINMSGGHASMMYFNACRATEIFEKSTDTPSYQKAEGYNMKAVAQLLQGNNAKCLQHLEEAIPLFYDNQGNPSPRLENTVFTMALGCYGRLFKDNPKDENLTLQYKKFMEEKLLYAIEEGKEPQPSSPRCYILEINDWDMNAPYAFDVMGEKINRVLMFQDGKFSTIEIKDNERSGGEMRLVIVDKAEKERILKLWTKYRKEHPLQK